MSKKGFVFGILMLSLMVMGIAYAQPSSDDSGVPTAGTDYLRIGIRNIGTIDQGPDPQHYQGGNPDPEKKDVAATAFEANGSPVFELNGIKYFDTISQRVTGAYPGYETGCIMEIANGGRVPCQIDNVVLAWIGSQDFKEYVSIHSFSIFADDQTVIASGTSWSDFAETLKNIELKPGEVVTAELRYYFKSSEEDPMPQNANGKIQVALDTSQEGDGGGGNGGGNGGNNGGDNGTSGGESGGGEPVSVPETVIVPSAPQVQAPATAPGTTGPTPERLVIAGRALPRLPYTGGNPIPYIVLGLALAGTGILVVRRS
ncbi:MAG: hypothetical protein HPY90_11135 [Syntrophothermus sp.]|uniref:hypothetical protein n=1 Tax=Syntrophothermus sp. TaxID=2736299 RepID=UPI00257B2DCC|nr:hypothetical protein [Syntrophothermus sp.]NSW83803.1 hypothetical protein [Syntrophothermus sp.]